MTGQGAAAAPHGHGALRKGRPSAAAFPGRAARSGRSHAPGRGVRGASQHRTSPLPRLSRASVRLPDSGFRSSPAGSRAPRRVIAGRRERGGDAATAAAARGLLLAGAAAATRPMIGGAGAKGGADGAEAA
jgi:hypothetical protein